MRVKRTRIEVGGLTQEIVLTGSAGLKGVVKVK